MAQPTAVGQRVKTKDTNVNEVAVGTEGVVTHFSKDTLDGTAWDSCDVLFDNGVKVSGYFAKRFVVITTKTNEEAVREALTALVAKMDAAAKAASLCEKYEAFVKANDLAQYRPKRKVQVTFTVEVDETGSRIANRGAARDAVRATGLIPADEFIDATVL